MVVDGNARMAHTSNMPDMLMTLDVLMLSGWLNADAICRVKEGSIGRGGNKRAGRARAWRRRRMQRAGKAPTVEAEGSARAERTENIHRMSVTLDVSRLSGWLNVDAPYRVKREA